MSDRHEKWVRVEPGTEVPAGQSYRAEWTEPHGPQATERTSSFKQTVPPAPEWFVDSSWKPPLVLPTEPTWGITIWNSRNRAGQWQLIRDGSRLDLIGQPAEWVGVEIILDFIPLTDEQVARIEAAR